MLTSENTAEAFHSSQHRYSSHRGKSPDEMATGISITVPTCGYRPPDRLPRRGRIEVVRFMSNRRLDLFGKHITLNEDQTYSCVTAVIRPRAQTVTVITLQGEVIHEDAFTVSAELR